LLERFISLPKKNTVIRDAEVSFGMIEREESRSLLTVFPVSYLSVGATLGQKGDNVTNTHVTQGP
jgi:hypothetical protein